ncbi:hypothetical protein [Sulfitobacter sediminilitoris]|uniref:hypothetical protein n=1 Tax=Sulfitobacter sediminilitoris TaxID=2698830 RepID=UPI00360DCC07
MPEPLKSLLDRMTAPDPNDRFQTMSDVLAFIDSGGAEEALDDATIIAPPPKTDVIAEAPSPPRPANPTPADKSVQKQSSGISSGLIVAGAAVVLIGGGAAAFFGGVFGGGGPTYPAVSPYSLVIENLENLPASASGFVPSADMQNALVTRMTEIGGATDLTLASGEIADSWSNDVLAVLDDISTLDDWQLTLNGNRAKITGSTSDPAVLTALTARYPETWPGALDGTIEVALTSLFLDPGDVDNILAQYADCGPVFQIGNPGPVGYGPDDPVVVKGTLAGEASREALQTALEDQTDGRDVIIDADILNPTLCLVENYLPEAPEGRWKSPSGMARLVRKSRSVISSLVRTL